MSGFEGTTGWYGLTPTKARYWHRYQQDGCRSDEDVVRRHLRPQDGWVVQDKRTWWRVTGPGLVDGFTADLWLAISGGSPDRASRDESRRWRH